MAFLLTRTRHGEVVRNDDDVILCVSGSTNGASVNRLVRSLSFGDDTWKVLRFVRRALGSLTRKRLVFEDSGRYFTTPEGLVRAEELARKIPRHTVKAMLVGIQQEGE